MSMPLHGTSSTKPCPHSGPSIARRRLSDRLDHVCGNVYERSRQGRLGPLTRSYLEGLKRLLKLTLQLQKSGLKLFKLLECLRRG